jgi:signal transduction histidine kinase
VRGILRIALFVMACVLGCVPAVAEPLARSVLILDGTEPNSPWGIEFRAVLRSVLGASPMAPVAIYSEVLDLARFNTSEYEDVLRSYLRGKYRGKPIGVIVVHGPEALNIFMRMRAELWPAVPVVFGSVDEATVARLALPPDIIGTILQFRLGSMVAAARALVPNLKRIALVGDPFERQPFRSHFTQELSKLADELEIIDLMGLPMAELKERVAVLPLDAAIVFVPLYVDKAGGIYISRDALGQVAEAANRPVISDVATHIGYGSTGGYMSLPEPVARVTTQLVQRILDGESVFSISVPVQDFSRPIFDWRQLKRFGIGEDRLPPGSEVRFKPQSLWERYWWQLSIIIAAFLLQTAMIAWLLHERRRRHSAELESRLRLREVLHLDRVAAVGAMSASIAHELNQPLGAIMANAEAAAILLTAETIDRDQVRDILTDIRRCDQRAGEIITHLRGLLKKQGETDLQEFDLNDALRDALRTLNPEAKRRGVLVSAHHLQGALPVRADKVHLEQVILNLATNAMDAMQDCPPGGRRMTLETVLTGKSQVEVSLADQGGGIPGDKLKGVFEAFYTTKQQGTGLGLSIVRTIVENCGGTIWAENRPGGGAVFRFTVPLAKVH